MKDSLPQAWNQLLLLHEEVQQDLTGVVESFLYLLHVSSLLQGVKHLLCIGTSHVTATLPHHVQVFPYTTDVEMKCFMLK